MFQNVQYLTVSAQDLARNTEGGPATDSPVELRSLLERILLEVRPKIQAQGLRFVYDAPGALPWVRGNSEGLHRAFKEIINDALEATPRGGMLSVSVDSFEQDGHPARVEIRVEDTGSGIPVDIQEKIFKTPFAARDQSSGLGLTVSRKIVNDHRGTLRVENELGKGTAFTVTLPLYT